MIITAKKYSVVLCLAAVSTIASAETKQDLIDKFESQLGETRGLVLVPADGAADEGTTEVAASPDGYTEVREENQVNIQIRFDLNSSALREDQKPKLATLCEAMSSVDVQLFQIIGHTDASGSDDYNKTLSEQRAQEVKRYLVTDCGISPTRLEAVGVGEDHLLDPSDPNGDVNRRVEFQALS